MQRVYTHAQDSRALVVGVHPDSCSGGYAGDAIWEPELKNGGALIQIQPHLTEGHHSRREERGDMAGWNSSNMAKIWALYTLQTI